MLLLFDLEVIHALLADKVLWKHIEHRIFDDPARVLSEHIFVTLLLQVTHVASVLVVDLVHLFIAADLDLARVLHYNDVAADKARVVSRGVLTLEDAGDLACQATKSLTRGVDNVLCFLVRIHKVFFVILSAVKDP